MKTSIIITFYQNFNILFLCLEYLAKFTDLNEVEVIVINDNPSLTLKQNSHIKEIIPNIIIIDSEKNMGYAGACNKAINYASGENIVLLDSDIMVCENWLNEMLEILNTGENAGGVSATILNMEDNSILHFGFATHKIDMIKPFFCRKMDDLPRLLHSAYRFPTITSGCCLFKKQLYINVNGMQENLYNAYCDLDLFYKFNSEGYVNYVSANTKVYHRGGVSGQARTALKADAKALFCAEWGKSFSEDGLTVLKNLYSAQLNDMSLKSYILFNFSDSLFSADYIEILHSLIELTKIYTIKLRSTSTVILDDHISFSLIRSRHPQIYFCDNFKQLEKNFFWFANRRRKGDMIIDRNGNVLLCDKLIH